MTPIDIPERTDVGVVGGGTIGLAVAHELAERGREVVVLDDATRPGISTWAAAGMLAPVAESDVELPGLCEFRRWSHSLYPEFVARVEAAAGVDCAFRAEGTLLVALDRDHAAEIERLRGIMEAQGFQPRPLTAAAAIRLEPGLVPRVVGGLLLEQDYCIDQRRLAQALQRAVERRGGRIVRDAIVERAGADGTVVGRRRNGAPETRFHMQCEHVVVAAGSWSGGGLDSPCGHLPLRPVRGQVVRLAAADVLRRVVRTPDVYMVPHAGGELVLGASVEEQGFDARPTAGAVFDLLRHAWRALPGIYDLPLLEVSVGFRPVCRDHLPAIGRMQGRVYAATGHYRNGILLAPGTARMLGLLLQDGAEHALLRYFDPQRFGRERATERVSATGA